MSREDVARLRRAFEALDRDGVEGLLPFLDPAVEWISIPGFLPDAEDHHGHEGVRRWFQKMDEVVERPRWEVEDVVEAGDRLIVESRVSGRGRSSGAPAEMVVFQVVTIRNHRAVRLESYLRREEAKAAAGGRHRDAPRDAVPEQLRADRDPPDSGSPGVGPISES